MKTFKILFGLLAICLISGDFAQANTVPPGHYEIRIDPPLMVQSDVYFYAEAVKSNFPAHTLEIGDVAYKTHSRFLLPENHLQFPVIRREYLSL